MSHVQFLNFPAVPVWQLPFLWWGDRQDHSIPTRITSLLQSFSPMAVLVWPEITLPDTPRPNWHEDVMPKGCTHHELPLEALQAHTGTVKLWKISFFFKAKSRVQLEPKAGGGSFCGWVLPSWSIQPEK